MVFSIFGKKGEPKKTENKNKAPIARQPVKPSPAKSAIPVASPQAGEDSLDFSAYVPAPLQVSPPPVSVPQLSPQDTELAAVAPPLDLSALASSLAAQAVAAPPTGSTTAVPGVPQTTLPPEPQAAAGDIAPLIEETATLFASGQAEQALAALSHSVREEDLGTAALQAWLMLFDLYQHFGRREEFEALALEFVVKFERSSPAWIDIEPRRDPALATGGIGYLALSGTLTEASAPELEKLRSAAGQAVRLECGNLLGLDGPGCRLLREALLSVRDAGKEVMFTGESRLVGFLEEVCQAGKIETDGAAWALLLDVYRMLDLKDKFEEAAVNYAVTFEVSPPSWEIQSGADPKRLPAVRSPRTADRALALSGEITGASETLAKQLREWVATSKTPVIDMFGTRRVDPAAAGLILNVLAEFHEAGTTVQIRGVNELIRVLFRVTGIDKVARVIPRK